MIERFSKLKTVFGFSLLIAIANAHSQEGDNTAFLEAQALRFEEKLNSAVKELSAINSEIVMKKEPLLVELNEFKMSVSKKRYDVDGLLLSKAETQQVLELARSDAQEREQHLDYATSLIGDYTSNFELRLNIAEDQRYREELTDLRLAWEETGETLSTEDLDNRFRMLDLAVTRLEGLLGGERLSGQAVDREGKLVDGDFLLYGPSSLFVSKDRSVFGGAEMTPNMLNPVIVESIHDEIGELGKLVTSSEGMLALDASMGKAASIESARWSIGDHVRKGGYVGYTIIVFAGLALLVAFVKLSDFAAIRASKEKDFSGILSLVRDGQISQSIDSAREAKFPFNRIMESALSNHGEEDEVIEEVVIGEIQKTKLRLDRLLPFLAITAAATPLMGLLGTVVGMIKTFALITVFGSGEAKSLSSGISEALVTTEFGLLVAIPTLLMHGAFVRMSKERVGALEDFASDFVVGLKKLRRKAADE